MRVEWNCGKWKSAQYCVVKIVKETRCLAIWIGFDSSIGTINDGENGKKNHIEWAIKKAAKVWLFFAVNTFYWDSNSKQQRALFFIYPMEKRTNKRMEKKFSKQILRLCGWSNEPYSQMRLKNTKKTLHSLSYSMSESWQKPRERSIMEIHVLHAFRIVPVYVHLIMVWKQSKKSVLLIFHRKLFHCIQQFFCVSAHRSLRCNFAFMYWYEFRVVDPWEFCCRFSLLQLLWKIFMLVYA